MDWKTYSGEPDKPGEHYNFNYSYNFFLLPQINLLRWLTFLLRSLTVTITILFLWISFFLLVLVLVLQWLSLHCKIMIRCCLSFH